MCHRIRCEICGRTTTKGIIEKDNGKRDRHFCSEECLLEKVKQDEEVENKRVCFWSIFKRK